MERRDTPKQRICTFYTNYGNCRHGDRCKFAHVDNNDSPGSNKPKKNEKEICKFYRDGFCLHGNECTFIHSNGVGPHEDYCLNYKIGHCMMGSKCKNSHTKDSDLPFDLHCFTYISTSGPQHMFTSYYYTRDGLNFYYTVGRDEEAKKIYRSRKMMEQMYSTSVHLFHSFHDVPRLIFNYIRNYHLYMCLSSWRIPRDLIRAVFGIVHGKFNYKYQPITMIQQQKDMKKIKLSDWGM